MAASVRAHAACSSRSSAVVIAGSSGRRAARIGTPRRKKAIGCGGRSRRKKGPCASAAATAGGDELLELTLENVETVLDEVRPYLMADGGNVSVIEIDGLVVRLRLEGACGSCPSSTTTMRMGIEVRRSWDTLQPTGSLTAGHPIGQRIAYERVYA